MKTWYYIKNWFTRKKEEILVVKKIPKVRTVTRKKRDNRPLTTKQVTQIRKFYIDKDEFGVKTYAEFTIFCNRKLSLNKSRSVYCRIIQGDEPYTFF